MVFTTGYATHPYSTFTLLLGMDGWAHQEDIDGDNRCCDAGLLEHEGGLLKSRNLSHCLQGVYRTLKVHRECIVMKAMHILYWWTQCGGCHKVKTIPASFLTNVGNWLHPFFPTLHSMIQRWAHDEHSAFCYRFSKDISDRIYHTWFSPLVTRPTLTALSHFF